MKTKPSPKPSRPGPKPRVAVAADPPARRSFDLWYLLAIFLLGFAIYWPSLDGPFVFDDTDIFETGTSVRLQNWRMILTGPRPLLISTYALNYRLAGGFNPRHFHLVSVLFHFINTVILWRLVRLLCGAPGSSGWWTSPARNLVVFFAPLLFLTSPIQTESVAYIASRSEVLAATFYFLALLVFLSGWREKRPWVAAALVGLFYACSVSSKEQGLTLPGAILLADYFFLAGRDWRGLQRNWPAYAVLAAETAAGSFIVLRRLISASSAGFFLAEVTWKDYLFTQFRMYFMYLRLLLVPFGLNADYDIAPSRGLFEHGSWLGLAGILLLLGAAIYLRRRFVLASFGVLFFFLTLFPTSSFYPLLDYAAERRLYVPAVGFFLAALALAVERWAARRALAVALGALLVVYAAGAHARSRVWADGLALWRDTAEKSPGKWRVYTWLGREYSIRRQFEEATRAYQKAAELVPPGTDKQVEVLSSLGSTYNNRKMYAQAIEIYQRALQIGETPTLLTNLAIAEIRLNRPDGWTRFERAIELNDQVWQPFYARGNLYYEMGRYDEAIRDYERVLFLVPEHADAQYNLNAARAMKQRQQK